MNQLLINKISNFLKNQPIDKAWIFGSFSRDEETADSDIDLMVKFTDLDKITLFIYMQLKYELETITGRKIDLVEEGQLKEFAIENFNKDNKLIYERRN